MNTKTKSVLDGVPVQEEGFPLRKSPQGESSPAPPKERWRYEIVGQCHHCGSPIYGARCPMLTVDEEPLVKYSCSCWRGQKDITDLMQTK